MVWIIINELTEVVHEEKFTIVEEARKTALEVAKEEDAPQKASPATQEGLVVTRYRGGIG